MCATFRTVDHALAGWPHRQIAGEHEDSYDSDFCIYNDVFVHHPDGAIDIYGYSESVFPPTDFHAATLLGDSIYIIGSVGYHGTRQFGTTPIYRFDTTSFRIEPVPAGGTMPGWIHGHRAIAISPEEIRISGGTLATWNGKKEVRTGNEASFILDTERLLWRAAV